MKLKELLDVCEYADVRLYSGYDGKLAAKAKKTLEKFVDVRVLSVYPKIELGRDADFARPYLFVFGYHQDIMEAKEKNNV